jgi:uncharacterized coiled-coil DUF342 family protein
MNDLKPVLEDMRKNVDRKATDSRNVRDEWNGKTREHLGTRNSFNSQVRELISEVQRQKAIRDEANLAVKEAKGVRATKNDEVRSAKETLRELSGETEEPRPMPGERRGRRERKETPATLQRLFERLDSEYERGMHTGKNEKKVMEKMKNIKKQIRDMKAAEDSNVELKDARGVLRIAIDDQEVAHQEVTEAAESAQEAHDLMLKLSEEVDRLREQADSSQALVRRAKREADAAHQSYIVSLRCLHSIQDILRAQRNKASGIETGTPGGPPARVGVQDLMSKLMAGETLSTEELMALQRGG